MKRHIENFIINIGLLFSGLIMAFSGLLIQIEYHMGNHGDMVINDHLLKISYYGWSNIHKFSIVIFSILMIFHIVQYWKWYKAVITKKIIDRNIQLITLFVVFILVAITGYIPWFINLIGGNEILRKIFIEIHDKLAIILFIYLILHVIKRLKWFFYNFR